MADEIGVSITLTATDGVVTEEFGDERGRVVYTLDQHHAAMRRYTKKVRGLPIVACGSSGDKFGFSIGDSIDMVAEREKYWADLDPSDTYVYNYLDFGADIIYPKIVTFYNMDSKWPMWIATLYRTTDNGSYTVIPFLEVPPGQTIGPVIYPTIENNDCDKMTETPLWFAMLGLPKGFSGDPEKEFGTLYTVVYDS